LGTTLIKVKNRGKKNVDKNYITFIPPHNMNTPLTIMDLTMGQGINIAHMVTNAPPNSLMDLTISPKGENNKRIKNWVVFFSSQHLGGRGACWIFRMGTRKSDKQVNYSHEPTQTNNKLISV
jgi:hypothetical protein